MLPGGQRLAVIGVTCGALLLPGAFSAVDAEPASKDRFDHVDHADSTRDRAQAFSLDLSGNWKFQAGDDPAWSSPGFDDSSWATVQVPKQYGHDEFKEYDGFGWYRIEFTLPKGA